MRCLGGSDLRLQPNNYFSGNHRFIYIDSLRRSRTSSWRLRYGDAVPWPGSVRDAVYDSQTQAANGQEYVVDELARSGDSRFTSDARMRWQQLKNGRNFSGDRDGDRHIRPNQPYRSCNHNHQLSRAPYSGAMTMRRCRIGGRISNRSQPCFGATSIKCTDTPKLRAQCSRFVQWSGLASMDALSAFVTSSAISSCTFKISCNGGWRVSAHTSPRVS